MDKVCSHCGVSAIKVDDEGKIKVCSNCGVVCNEGRNDDKSQGGLGTSGTLIILGEAEKGQDRVVHSTNFANSKKCLENQAERLHLPKEYITQAEQKVKTLYTKQLYKGLPRNRKAYVGSCVYIVCRQNDMVVTLRNVAEAAQCEVSVLARCVRILAKKMNVHLGTIEPDQIITNILSQFEIHDPNTKKLVHDLFEFCSKTMISSGKTTVLSVMALVFMSIESINGEAISLKKIEEVCRLNTVKHEYVRRFVRNYRAELFKLAKKIPWISSKLTPKQVPTILKEILEYYKDCEDFQNVDFKPQWLERKEQMEKEQNQKA